MRARSGRSRRNSTMSKSMLIKTTIPAAFLLVLGCGAAFAQVGPTASPLGITSPLGIGPGSAVPPVGVPMGALELATPGLSPPPSNTNSTACSTVGAASALFDGGGNAGSGSSTGNALDACAPPAATPTRLGASASSPDAQGLPQPVGRVGLPLGATELSPGGLSPPPLILPPNLPTPPLSPMPGSATTSALSSSSTSSSNSSASTLPSSSSPSTGLPGP
jgi:hypothetical protein